MTALDAALEREAERAALRLRLDEELGNWHGLSWADFVLLHALAGATHGWPTADLARHLGLTRPALVLQLLPLEKLGVLAREQQADGARRVLLRAGGRRLLHEAQATAQAACAGA